MKENAFLVAYKWFGLQSRHHSCIQMISLICCVWVCSLSLDGHCGPRRVTGEGGRGWPLGAAPAEPAFDSAALLLTIQRVFHLLLSSVPNLYFCASPGGCLLLQCWSPGTTDPKQLQMVLSSSFGANCMYIFFRFNIQIQLIYIFLCWQKLKFSHAFSRVTVCILDCTEVTKQGNQTSPVVDAVLLSVNQP